jgi:hypothetical protein
MSQNQPQNRQSRASATREEGVRIERQWTPPSLLPDVDRKPGYAYRWIRRAVRGTSDDVYFNKALREGWEPCKLSDHAEVKLHTSPRADAQDKDVVEVGGLILCQMPIEMARQRDAHYQGISKAQNAAESSRLQSINDPRMPMLRPSTREDVEFGKGRNTVGEVDE